MTDKTILFTAVWCGACKQLKGKLSPDIEEIDIETERGEELGTKYNVTSLPTTVTTDEDGNVTRKITGTRDIMLAYGTLIDT